VVNSWLRTLGILTIGALTVGHGIVTVDRPKQEPKKADLKTAMIEGFSEFGPLEHDTTYLEADGGTLMFFRGTTPEQKKRAFFLYCRGIDVDGNGLEMEELDEVQVSQLSKRSRKYSESVKARDLGGDEWIWVIERTKEIDRAEDEEDFEKVYEVNESEVLRVLHDMMLNFEGRAPVRPQPLYSRDRGVQLV